MLARYFYPYLRKYTISKVHEMLERSLVYLRPIKSLGQNFLVNKAVAEAEAEHALGKNVLELGSGYGMLTKELCKKAKLVVSVELDRNLFSMLKHEMKEKNLKLINKDFFKASEEELELKTTDIMISNVPYTLSSKVISFLAKHRLQAVLCLQKEFVEHMIAEAGAKNYSKLSVMFQLGFSHTRLLEVSKGSFMPVPKVDSTVIYIKPKDTTLTAEESGIINAIMQHKKKTLRNAIVDSHQYFGKKGKELELLAESVDEREERVFKLNPERLLAIARKLAKENSKGPALGQV